ncbi:MAG: HDIG domain-containing metalloprotein [Candidatus Margulisiibacteriota bacterium]|jgi:hypothetical protein
MNLDRWKNFLKWLKQSTMKQIMVLLFFSVIITIIVILSFINLTFIPIEGVISPQTIVSPIGKILQTEANKLETERLREARVGLVEEVFTIDGRVIQYVKSNIISLFTDIQKMKSGELASAQIIQRYRINKAIVEVLGKESLESDSYIESFILNALENIMADGVVSVRDPAVEEKLQMQLTNLSLPFEAKMVIRELIKQNLRPNKVIDKEKTAQAQLNVQDSIQPIQTWIREGQVIVYKGDKITRDQIEILRELNLYGLKIELLILLILIMICLFIFWSYIFGIVFLRKELRNDTRKIALLALIFTVIALFARILEPISGYLVPVPLAAILISIFFDPIIALFAVAHLSIMVGVLYNLDFSLFLVMLFSSILSIYTVRNATQRTTITRTGFEISLANVILISMLSIIRNDPMNIILLNCLWGVINGIVSALLSLGLLPPIENTFKMVTTLRLNELTNPGHPLLRRLMVEAPGTYQHSLMVANLAEAAVEAVGGNVLLTRAGCYYHDIGKIRRPAFFVENQRWADNPHDRLDPKLSALIITTHPKDGYTLLKEYQLEEILSSFVLEHHGTGRVSYFYRQMLSKKDQNFDEEQFRYEGPKPKSKETAILMLADMVEAAVRTLERPTPSKLEGTIEKLFKEKFEDGQLDNAPLTMFDISTIKQKFLAVLTNAMHKRIEYPDNDQKKEKK